MPGIEMGRLGYRVISARENYVTGVTRFTTIVGRQRGETSIESWVRCIGYKRNSKDTR
jgi:hypothetical protein